jgi:hypothetical protein
MNDMVERVARAMAAAIVSQVRSGATFEETPNLHICDEDSNSFWELIPVARAAIEAMREPTDDTLKAAALVWDEDWCTETNALNMWNKMIESALT